MQIEYNDIQTPQTRIIVAVRKRPLNRKEISKSDQDIVDVLPQSATVIVKETRTKVDLTKYIEENQFNFDAAFDEFTSNEQLYLTVVRPIVEAAFNKAKVTCFAYGQTGSGKTYTMLGDPNVPGLYLLAAHDIFALLNHDHYSHLSVTISFYEIYCGKLFDLLNERSLLQAREDAKGNVNIVGLQERKVGSVEQIMKIIDQGSSVRVTSQNSSNTDSSRSHAILQISIKDPSNKMHGKLSFIDLAGSERGADVSDQNKQTRFDGAEINKSLLALKECIRALDLNKNHTPFRGSKLTLVLKDSFVGNCRTVMIGNFSPSSSSSEHTLNTLRYADRVKELKKPTDLKEQVGSLDKLARELMLPRQQLPQPRMQSKKSQDPPPVTQAASNQFNKNPLSNNIPPQTLFQPAPYQMFPSQPFTEQPRIQSKNSNQYSNENIYPPRVKPEEELVKIGQKHEQLISVILEEEENLIQSHRQHIDQMVELVKQEMMLLHNVDKPGSDVDEYVKGLDQILLTKVEEIQGIRTQLQTFRQHLWEEEQLQKQFYQQRSSQFVPQQSSFGEYDLRMNENEILTDNLNGFLK